MRSTCLSRLAVGFGLAAALLLSQPHTASAVPTSWVRISGADRYATAVELSKDWYSTGANLVVVASGEAFPDALAAGPMAALQGGPVLLTRANSLPLVTAVEIARLRPTRIKVIGGPAAISDSVLNELKTLAPTVRISGADRRATAVEVSRSSRDELPIGGLPAVWVASGDSYTDALVAASHAAIDQVPVLLAPHQGLLDATTMAEIRRLNPAQVRFVGSGISADAINQVRVAGFGTVHVQGATPASLSAHAVDYHTPVMARSGIAYLASQENFPDALAAVAVAGHVGSPVYLAEKTCLHWEVWYQMAATGADTVRIVGGPAALVEGIEATQCP